MSGPSRFERRHSRTPTRAVSRSRRFTTTRALPTMLVTSPLFPAPFRSHNQSRSCTHVRRALAANAPMQTLHSEVTSTPTSPAAVVRNAVAPHRVLLWRLHGATNDLSCVAVETSYGYALCLELGGEPVLLELQRSLELLIAKASRLEASLLARGWQIASA
jgi:hypothetical protein